MIIILGLLGLSLANQLRAGSQNVVYDVLGARALLAAQTGLEHASSLGFPLSAIPANDAQPVNCNGQTVTSAASLSDTDGLRNCSYTARCGAQEITKENSETYLYYQFESTGVCQSGEIWASRRVAQDGFIKVD
ncbi:hypothetical protein DRW07_15575 [Alteromonas sediminis]|uniref:MSHA biogenesis protein MshP n=1 Tax=Alteromonas sediminis TaxID=2259342 RepID=A0A3N5XXW1_9ALTE|nr:hypothetical protein [Alteromonas sediminis]RPJ65323.1 hypothetical protein DRW07_15575 [Alteromonas sediminis]